MNTTNTSNKLPKYVNIALSEEEAKFVLAELGECFDTKEAEEMSDELIERIRSKLNSAVATNMWYFNSYNTMQVYEGPEEGGWWHEVTECVGSQGFSISNTEGGLDELYRVVVKEFEGLDEEPPTFEEFILHIRDFGYYAFRYGYDEYGDGTFLAVERAPAAQENIRRQHYE